MTDAKSKRRCKWINHLRTLAFITLLVMIPPAFAGPSFEDLQAMVEHGEYDNAAPHFEVLADAGDLRAQGVLAHMYLSGKGRCVRRRQSDGLYVPGRSSRGRW